jgi:integrase/recombinase XerD
MVTKKSPEELRENKLMNQAKREVLGFEELIYRFERTVSVLGRSKTTFGSYFRRVVAVAIYYGKIPTKLDQEQIHETFCFISKKVKNTFTELFCIFR